MFHCRCGRPSCEMQGNKGGAGMRCKAGRKKAGCGHQQPGGRLGSGVLSLSQGVSTTGAVSARAEEHKKATQVTDQRDMTTHSHRLTHAYIPPFNSRFESGGNREIQQTPGSHSSRKGSHTRVVPLPPRVSVPCNQAIIRFMPSF